MTIVDRRGITVDGTVSSAASSEPYAGLAIKTPVRVATTANITLSGLQSIDGVTVAASDRVLVKDQTTGTENGIYLVSTGNWTRTTDFDSVREVVKGTVVYITDGTVNAGGFGHVTASDPITLGTTTLTIAVLLTQPLDSDLSAIAALSTTAYGRAFLALADASAARTALTLGTIATQNANSVAVTGGSVTGITDLAIADGGTGQSTAATGFDALAPTTTRGDIIFRNATTNARLAAGTSGYALIAAGAGADPAWTGFVQAGTGAATRTWQTKARETFSVKDFGAVGDGSTNDTVAIQAAIDAAIAAGGGTIHFPASSGTYKTTTQLLIDLSSYGTRYQNRIILRGAGPGPSAISNTTLGGNVIKFLGNTANVEAYFSIESLRITGANVASSVGLNLTNMAFARFFNVSIEGFAIGIDATDVEQIGVHDSAIRYNDVGVRGNAAVSITSANSWTFVNTALSNNSIYGAQITNPNALTWLGGSIQYNGTIGGGTGQFGIKLIDAGNTGGYGTILFAGMIFEGNGGAGDFVSSQQAGSFRINCTFNAVSFLRTDVTTVGYGTNQIAISGAGTNANYKVINSSFWGAGAYAANAARPAIANTNTNAIVELDSLTTFWSATEVPAIPSITQATNKTTGVTLNKTFGQITMNNAALASVTAIAFTLTNAMIAAGDLVTASHGAAGTAGSYQVSVSGISAGSCGIVVRNTTAGSLSEAIVINFKVDKARTV